LPACYDSCVPVTADFREFVLEQLGRVAAIDWKRMFGGVGLYADGTFFALIDDDIVYFKVGDLNRADFEAAGARAFRPYEGTTSTNYYELPVEVLEDVDALRTWTEKSVAVAMSAAAGKRKKKPSA
jgi:DNA transformation protein